MEAVLVEHCGTCPFCHSLPAYAASAGFARCKHPKAGPEVPPAFSVAPGRPEWCPLRKWSCLVQTAEPGLAELIEREGEG